MIELLVVIAIIALLVSILTPSLQQAKELARAVVCLSNGRGIATAHAMYTETNEQYVASAVRWPVELLPYFGQPGILMCPNSEADMIHQDADGTRYARMYSTKPYEWEEPGKWHGDFYVDPNQKYRVYGVRSGCSYGWNYRAFGWWWQKGNDARPRVDDYAGELVIIGENNIGPYQRNSYAILTNREPGSPGSTPSIHFNERHSEKGTLIRLSGNVEQVDYYDVDPEDWLGQ